MWIHFSSCGDLVLTGQKRISTHNLCDDVTITYSILSDTVSEDNKQRT